MHAIHPRPTSSKSSQPSSTSAVRTGPTAAHHWFARLIPATCAVLWALAAFSVQAATGADHAPLALVIGNAEYAIDPLMNTANDAEDVSGKLSKLGYTVLRGQDLNKRQMLERLSQFEERIVESENSSALFYYAGHAVQIQGRNYLIPTGEEITDVDTLVSRSIDVNDVLASMESAGALVKVLVLDACRDNPFAKKDRYSANGRSLRIDRGLKLLPEGLAPMKGPRGTYIAYATDPGRTASDGDGRNGLYTKHLLKYLDMPSVPAEAMFKLVRAEVISESNGTQIPWEHSSLTSDFYFNNPVEVILRNARTNLDEGRYGDAYRYAKEAYARAISDTDRRESRELIHRVRTALGYAN